MVTNLESMDTTLARAAVQVATRDRAEKDAEATCTEKNNDEMQMVPLKP